jgi:transcriptional regulator with XRE-family HTH domain
MVITPAQIRAARALLGLTPEEVAARARIPVATLRALEEAATPDAVPETTLVGVQGALEDAGIQFIDEGVRRWHPTAVEIEQEFRTLMDISRRSAARLAGQDLLTDDDLFDENGLPA